LSVRAQCLDIIDAQSGEFPLNAKTNCLTAAQLQTGQRYETSLVFSREDVERYCALSGDHNAIHANVEAAQLRFPGVPDIIVPGGLLQIAITGIFGTQFPGDGSLGLVFTPERLRKPVCPGETVNVVIEVARIRGELVELDVAISNAEGASIGGAKSRVLAPDKGYQEWWARRQSAS
jgi:acyl dehydratase